MIDIRQIQRDEWEIGRSVRLAALQDSPCAFSETYANAVVMPDDFWRGRAERGARGEASFSALAFADDEPIGMAVGLADPEDSAVAYLVAMWVAPEHRGTHVASSLVDAVADWAASRGASNVFAGVLLGNSRAASFYRKVGFAVHEGGVPKHPATDGAEVVLSRTVVGCGEVGPSCTGTIPANGGGFMGGVPLQMGPTGEGRRTR